MANPTGDEFVAQARKYLGVPYVWGGTTPKGLDCSGLVYLVAHNLGIMTIPRTSQLQWGWTEHTKDPRAGTLVFFVGSDGEPGKPGHVGIVVSYSGNSGSMIDAPFTGQVVQVAGFSTNGKGADAFVGFGNIPGVTTGSLDSSTVAPAPSGVTTPDAAASGIVTTFVGAALIFGLVLLFIVIVAIAIIYAYRSATRI